MKAIVKIANVYDGILEEEKKELVVVKGNKAYVGPLFFPREDWEKVRKPICKVEVEGTAQEIILKAYDLLKEEGMIAKDGKTLKTMLHWQFMNGFSDELIATYNFENDDAYLASMN